MKPKRPRGEDRPPKGRPIGDDQIDPGKGGWLDFYNDQNQKKINSGGGFKLFRGGSELTDARGDAYGSMYRVAADFGANANQDQSGMTRSIVYLDSPGSTSSIEYRVYAWAISNAQLTVCGSQYGNGTTNQSDDGRFISTYTVMEIGGS